MKADGSPAPFGAHVHGAMLVVGDDADDVPPATSSAFDMLCWARTQPRGVRFVPFSAASYCIELECLGPYYQLQAARYWSQLDDDESHVNRSEVVIALIGRKREHFAVMPTGTWVAANRQFHYLNDLYQTPAPSAPAWMAPFMVHSSQLVEAIGRVIDAARDSSRPYVNPTTNLELSGWQPACVSDFSRM